MKSFAIVPVICILCFGLAGCGGGGSSTSSAPPAVTVASLAVTAPSSSLAAGKTLQLKATVIYSDNTTSDVSSSATWTSSDSTIATVSNSGLLTALKAGSFSVKATDGTTVGTMAFTATGPTLSSLEIIPGSTNLAIGQSIQLAATGIFSDGSTQDVTSAVSWSSNNPLVASVNASSGFVTAGSATGGAKISAASGAINASASITVTAVSLTSITVTPANGSIAAGQTQQYVASGGFSDGSTSDITNSVVWASAPTSIATISTTGMATGVATGSASISATSGAVVGTAPLAVTSAVLQSIDISPDTASIPLRGQVQFSVAGTFSDNTTQNLTNAVYTSSDPTTATIDAQTGIATGVAPSATGTTVTITVAYGGFTDTAQLTVLPPTLVSLAMVPPTISIAAGTTTQFTLTGTFNDGSVETLSQGVSWTSSPSIIAGVDQNGVATGNSSGQATISASYGGQTASATLTVLLGAPVSISVTPALPTIGPGGAVQFSATGVFVDGSQEDLTTQVQWASSVGSVALIGNAGLANALATGTTQISAIFQGVTGSTTLTVAVPTLVSINVTPPSPIVPPHTTIQFTAIGVYSDGSTSTLAGVHWYTSRGSGGFGGWWGYYISQSGVLRTSRRNGTVTVYASLNGIIGSTVLTVTNTALTSLAITPATATIAPGTTQQFTLTGYYGSTPVNLTQSAYWSTSSWQDADIFNNGLTQGRNPGQVTITANYQGMTAQATLTVSTATIVSVSVTPPAPTITLGSSQQFAATGTFSDNTTQDITGVSNWSSSNGAVAVMRSRWWWWGGQPGLAFSAGPGQTTINATFGTQTGSTTLTVN